MRRKMKYTTRQMITTQNQNSQGKKKNPALPTSATKHHLRFDLTHLMGQPSVLPLCLSDGIIEPGAEPWGNRAGVRFVTTDDATRRRVSEVSCKMNMIDDSNTAEGVGEQELAESQDEACSCSACSCPTDREAVEASEQAQETVDDAVAAEAAEAAARAARAAEALRKRKAVLREVVEYVQSIALAMVLAVVIMTFIGRSFVVEGASMEPTLHNRERIIVEKVSYRFHDPERGDIVVLKNPWRPDFTGWEAAAEAMREIVDLSGSMRPYIKRVIAVEGDTIQIQDGIVYLNGEALEEDYIAEHPWADYPLVTVPEDHVFVMGDNRNNSDDSRGSVGFLKTSRIMGKAVFRYYPISRVTTISRPDVFED